MKRHKSGSSGRVGGIRLHSWHVEDPASTRVDGALQVSRVCWLRGSTQTFIVYQPAITALCILGASPLPDQEEVTIMAQLLITELTCDRQEDSNLHDEVILQVNGVPVSGPHNMATGDVLALNVQRGFTGTATVNLIEQDRGGAGVSDFLGVDPIFDNEAPNVDHTGHLHATQSLASYHMTYRVIP